MRMEPNSVLYVLIMTITITILVKQLKRKVCLVLRDYQEARLKYPSATDSTIPKYGGGRGPTVSQDKK